ncbi:MAG: hypothetical protein QG610_1797 [Euryarchaeota archaeon]|nr:hypothetical protein [Euryarchaeota archaeon]
MDICKEFNPYSCEEYILRFERKDLDFEEIRRDYTGKRTKET